MKKLIIFTLALAFLATSCNQDKIAQLESENTSLRTEKKLADSLQNNFYDCLIEIESNISAIKGKEKMISESKVTGEKNQSLQDKILQDLVDINDLMEKNRKRLGELESLRKKMQSANLETSKLQEMIKSLEEKVAQQDAEIQQLQSDLKIANEKIVALSEENKAANEENQRKQSVIDEQTIAINTAYYTIGTSQVLRESGVVTRTGGFIGLGKSTLLSQDVNEKYFTKIDIREFKRLETNSEKISLITPHPSSSYELDNSNPKNIIIVITNSSEFWKSSKYLVVRVR